VTDSAAVSWDTIEAIFSVRLNFPPANALGLDLIEGLDCALDAFDASPARVLVVSSGLDRFFAAGADIKLMDSFTDADGPERFAQYGQRLRAPLDRLAGHERPSVAAIDGIALGGGLELALAATLRVGSQTARLGLPESRLGLIPGAGGTQRLPRLVGRGRALDIMLTAREVPADEAYAMGLLDRLVPAGTAVQEAHRLARALTGRSPAALTEIMRCVDDAYDLPMIEGLSREAKRVTALFGGEQAREGLRAFLGKRRPEFR
jgi:enoyl-CoA hydratase